MWRADDDLSDDNYLEALYALATESPGCKLAVSTAVLADWDLRPLRVSEPPVGLDPASARDRIRALLASGPPWYYGLWDRETLRAAYLGVLGNFSYPFGSDHLTVYGPAIDGVVRTTTATRIVMRIRRAPKAGGPRGRTRFAVMWEIPPRLHPQSAPHSRRTRLAADPAHGAARGPALLRAPRPSILDQDAAQGRARAVRPRRPARNVLACPAPRLTGMPAGGAGGLRRRVEC